MAKPTKSVRYQIMVPKHVDDGVKEILTIINQPQRDYLIDLLKEDQKKRGVGVYAPTLKN
jgi:hypothetical protein